MRFFPACVMALLLLGPLARPPAAQEEAGGGGAGGDPALWIGMDLPALLAGFGPPRSVYAVRGVEERKNKTVHSGC